MPLNFMGVSIMLKKYLFLAIILSNQTASPFAAYIAEKLRDQSKSNPKYFSYQMNKQFEKLQKEDDISNIYARVDNPLAYKIAGSAFFGGIGTITGWTLAGMMAPWDYDYVAHNDYRPYVVGACAAAGVAFGWRICKYSYIPAIERIPQDRQTELLNEWINGKEVVKMGAVAGAGALAAQIYADFRPSVLY